MAKLSAQEKKEFISDARSPERREDFRRMYKSRYLRFPVELLEELSCLAKVAYPRHIIKTDRNRL